MLVTGIKLQLFRMNKSRDPVYSMHIRVNNTVLRIGKLPRR